MIGLSAFSAPLEFDVGRRLLLGVERGAAWASTGYYVVSALWIAISLVPFCTCMGATFPLAMAAIRAGVPTADRRSFSILYAANVLGATSGTLLSAFVLIELLGFRGTLAAAALVNATIGAAAFLLSHERLAKQREPADAGDREVRPTPPDTLAPPRGVLAMLFATGLTSMAMEVIWVRQFTPYLGTLVYAFATILGLYLAATFVGATAYRWWGGRPRAAGSSSSPVHAWALAGVLGLAPLFASDPRLPLGLRGGLIGPLRVACGVAPFCAAVGVLTPMLVDRWSGGDPDRAGRGYAVNIVGCIIGPLVAGFLLLPLWGERWSLVAATVPLFALWISAAARSARAPAPRGTRALRAWIVPAVVALACAGLITMTRDFETVLPRREVRRDYEATVLAAGDGLDKQLLVNGFGMTVLTPITKMMVHLPLALRPAPPKDALVICFGMGTSFRSALSWGIPTTAVELVPSVPDLFGYYHANGPALLRSPLATVVIDDGRRFLDRTTAQYDLITIDPPPPVEAAGSSLLYSTEFYAAARRHLRPGGVLQQWLPEGDRATYSAVTKALLESFPHVRAFRAVLGPGVHFVASNELLPRTDVSTVVGRLPPAAAADLVEWWPGVRPEAPFGKVLNNEIDPQALADADRRAPTLQDDHPVNEYFLLRRYITPYL